jgi:hypothetical protein
MVTVAEPQSRDDILRALEHLRDEGLNFWRNFDPEQFVARLGDAWSPADNVRHLIKSTVP